MSIYNKNTLLVQYRYFDREWMEHHNLDTLQDLLSITLGFYLKRLTEIYTRWWVISFIFIEQLSVVDLAYEMKKRNHSGLV